MPSLLLLIVALVTLMVSVLMLMPRGHQRHEKPLYARTSRDLVHVEQLRDLAAPQQYVVGDRSRRWRPSGRWILIAQGEALRA